MKRKFAGVLILVIALACPVAGWQGKKKIDRRGGDSATARDADALKQEAIRTLQYLKNSAFEIESLPDRVRVLLEIADALWVDDPQQARDVFKQSFERAVEYENSLDEKQRPASDASLRQMVITRVARHDPSLADNLLNKSLVKQSVKEPDAFGQLYGRENSRNELLVNAATTILPSDVNRSVQMARLAASEGMSQGLRLFLLNLRSKDLTAADALFEVVFNAASARRPKDLAEALFLWDYAFQRNTIYLGPVSWERESKELVYPVALGIKKRALSFAVDAIIENAKEFNIALASESEKPIIRERYVLLHSLASQILPDVEKYLPSALPVLHVELRRLDQELNDLGRKPPAPPEPLPDRPKVQESIDKLIERASGVVDAQARDGLYARAVFRLYLHGDHERAINLARKIENPSLALMLTEPIKFDRAGDLISRGDLETAAEVARSIETLELRAAVLVKIGSAYFNAKNLARTVEILNEAELVAAKASPSIYLASAMLGIALIHLDNDWNRGLEVTFSALRAINSVEEENLWDILHAGEGAGRLAVQKRNWSTRKDGGINSISVVYPRTAGLLDVLLKLSERNLGEGLMFARQLKSKSLSFAIQAKMCRQAIERAQVMKKSSNKGKLRSE